MGAVKQDRVIVYVDGFNLYFGMVESGFEAFRWLDIVLLATACLKAGQTLVEVKYFTASITNDSDKEKRQRTYIDALIAKGAKIIRGKYEQKRVDCGNCPNFWFDRNEKMTDVNIATSLIMDAYRDVYDVAILISGDSDLIPAIIAVNNNFGPKIVTVAFPPSRHNTAVASVAVGSYQLGRKTLKDCQMDEQVASISGYILQKPPAWK